jgi:DNA polymerase I-like protein with 3'-5' exonuclease and polymerase domains
LLCENIIQALARGVIVEYLVTIGAVYTVAHQCHDEIICIVATSKVATAKTFIETTMSTPVAWLPGLPVNCEVKDGPNYGAAK